jgi:hypothetical protein
MRRTVVRSTARARRSRLVVARLVPRTSTSAEGGVAARPRPPRACSARAGADVADATSAISPASAACRACAAAVAAKNTLPCGMPAAAAVVEEEEEEDADAPAAGSRGWPAASRRMMGPWKGHRTRSRRGHSPRPWASGARHVCVHDQAHTQSATHTHTYTELCHDHHVRVDTVGGGAGRTCAGGALASYVTARLRRSLSTCAGTVISSFSGIQ